GSRREFDVPLDHTLSTGFRQRVQRYLPRIGYGDTLTYKEVAALVGNPGAVRAVGTACATNPLPIVVPCHRVLRSDGGLGGYLGGLAPTNTLLPLEKAICGPSSTTAGSVLPSPSCRRGRTTYPGGSPQSISGGSWRGSTSGCPARCRSVAPRFEDTR